jgi:hypothetical protein
LEDIQTVRVNRGLLFAAMEVEVRGYETNPNPITHLWPEDASKAEKYIMTLTTLKKENVDVNTISVKKLRKKLGMVEDKGEVVTDLK